MVKQSLNPVWHEQFDMKMFVGNAPLPQLEVTVWDKASGKDEFMGRWDSFFVRLDGLGVLCPSGISGVQSDQIPLSRSRGFNQIPLSRSRGFNQIPLSRSRGFNQIPKFIDRNFNVRNFWFSMYDRLQWILTSHNLKTPLFHNILCYRSTFFDLTCPLMADF